MIIKDTCKQTINWKNIFHIHFSLRLLFHVWIVRIFPSTLKSSLWLHTWDRNTQNHLQGGKKVNFPPSALLEKFNIFYFLRPFFQKFYKAGPRIWKKSPLDLHVQGLDIFTTMEPFLGGLNFLSDILYYITLNIC